MIGTRLPVIFAMVATCLFAGQLDATERPNILFIFADDWGWGDLSCHGHPYVKTPNIDRLASEGTDFHRFTVASGVCSPSRTAVMTGHFPARYNIDGHFAWVPSNARRNMPDWLDPKAPLLPRMLQRAGYATAHYGKWHLANNMIPDSPLPGIYGYDQYGAYNCAGEQMPVHEDSKHAVDFIERAVYDDKPFFVNLWLHEPHTPFHTVPKYEWRFRHLESETDRIYASVLSHADDRVGEVLDTLDRLGVAENTLVIFSSDNGPARAAGSTELKLSYDTATGAGWGIAASKGITGGRRGYKAALFEGGIGVPFIARWPGKIAAGKVDASSLISAVDLLPTFCEIAGVDLPDGYKPDGVSQVETLKGKPGPSREKPLFWKYPSRWPASKSRPDHWVSYAVVHQNWKLVSNRDGSHVELHDIAASPYEDNDLKASKPEVVVTLLNKIENWKATLPTRPTGDVFSSERKTLDAAALASQGAHDIVHEEGSAPARAAKKSTDHYPAFSWDTIPLYMHMRKATKFTQEEVNYLAGFPLITLEKTTGSRTYGSSEAGSREAAKAIKAVNPETKVLYYRNVVCNYNTYQVNEGLKDIPGAFLEARDGNTKLHRGVREIYDLANPALRKWWVDHCVEMARYDEIDGLFLDGNIKALEPAYLRREIGAERKQTVAEGYAVMMKDLKDRIPSDKLLVANLIRARLTNSGLDYMQYFDGSYLENIESQANGLTRLEYLTKGIAAIQQAARKGKIICMSMGLGEAALRGLRIDDSRQRLAPGANTQSRLEYCLALFLICAEKYSYVFPHDGYDVNNNRSSIWLKRFPEYDKPLGPPKSRAVQDGYTYTREFEFASVFLDIEKEEAKITWKR